MPSAEHRKILCLDFGSTYTKALLIGADGTILGATEHRTTIDSDVMDAHDACARDLPGATEVLACSSAGGGLRILVIGQEELVTAEAGRRVALSSGGAVVGVCSRPYDADSLARELDRARADVVLLTGGTDGGNAAPLLDAARDLAASPWRGPVVIAGNSDVAADAAAILHEFAVEIADNVLPRIGVLAPNSARRAIRALFLTHVIGGKHLSSRPEFLELVRGATPDVVLTGVEVLADAAALPTGVVVVDVGGATTDVHSVVRLDAETGDLGREVVAETPVTRTVEADLGMRWSAASTARAAVAAGLAGDALLEAGRMRADQVGFIPRSEQQWAAETEIARVAVTLAVRRHAGRSRVVLSPEGRVIERTGKDLREVDLLIGTGGVFRHAREDGVHLLASATGETTGGWQQPEHPDLGIDRAHALAAIGLLAGSHPETSRRLAREFLRRLAPRRATP